MEQINHSFCCCTFPRWWLISFPALLLLTVLYQLEFLMLQYCYLLDLIFCFTENRWMGDLYLVPPVSPAHCKKLIMYLEKSEWHFNPVLTGVYNILWLQLKWHLKWIQIGYHLYFRKLFLLLLPQEHCHSVKLLSWVDVNMSCWKTRKKCIFWWKGM